MASLLDRHRDSILPAVPLYYDEPVEFVRGQGARVWDAEGKEYLDFLGGIVTVISGHNVPEITEALKEQLERISHTSTLFLIGPQVELAEWIKERAPEGLTKAFFVNSGSEANDAALLLASLYNNGGNELLALRHSYHGRSFAAQAATGIQTWRAGSLSPFQVHFAPNPYCYRCPLKLTYPSCGVACAQDIESIIQTCTSGHPFAFIAEPIQGLGGFITPPPEYFSIVKEILDRYGILFISDEAQTAWGRLGTAYWGATFYNVTPDIVTFAKGLGNGLPIGGLLAREDVARSLKSLTISTFGGNPLITAGALANLKYIERQQLQQNAQAVGEYFKQGLQAFQAKHSLVGEVRGQGLMLALEFVLDRESKAPATQQTALLLNETKRRGLVVGRGGLYGNVIRLSPPLTISQADVDEALRIMDEALTACTVGVRA